MHYSFWFCITQHINNEETDSDGWRIVTLYLQLDQVSGSSERVRLLYYGCPSCCGPRSHNTAFNSSLSPFFSVKDRSHTSFFLALRHDLDSALFFSSFTPVSCPYYQYTLLGMVCRPQLVTVCFTGCSQCFFWRPAWFFILFFFGLLRKFFFFLLCVLFSNIFVCARVSFRVLKEEWQVHYLYIGYKQNNSHRSAVGFCTLPAQQSLFTVGVSVSWVVGWERCLFVLHLCSFLPFPLCLHPHFFLCFLLLYPPLSAHPISQLNLFIPHSDSSTALTEKNKGVEDVNRQDNG